MEEDQVDFAANPGKWRKNLKEFCKKQTRTGVVKAFKFRLGW